MFTVLTIALALASPDLAGSARTSVTAGYYGAFLTHPGLVVGIERAMVGERAHTLTAGGRFAAYLHPQHHLGLSLRADAIYRAKARVGLYGEVMASAGVHHRMLAGPVYVGDGAEVQRRVDLGNLAAPGVPLGVIESAGGLQAKVSIPETHAGMIQVGDEAEVWIEGTDEPVPGRVSEVQGVDAMSRSFTAEVALPEDLPEMRRVRPGMFVRVGFQVGDAQGILIPSSSVMERGQLEMVYVV